MLRYHIKQRKNPISGQALFCAELESVTPMSMDELADAIAAQCTVTRHDVIGVLSSLEEQLFVKLRDGYSIRFGDLGSFHPTLRTTGATEKSLFHHGLIKRVHVAFTKSSHLKQMLDIKNPKVKFMEVKGRA